MNYSSFVESRCIGDAVVTVISEETVTVPMAWAIDVPEEEWRAALPNIGADGKERFGQNVVHIALDEASILIDTGFDAPESDWGRRHAAMLDAVRTPGTEAGLASIGVRPDQITHVCITHGHWDHYIGATVERDRAQIARYPHATYFLGRADLEGAPEPELTDRMGVIERSGRLRPIDGDTVVVPGVSMLHTSGESPGHYVVRLESGGELFYALSDLFHHPCEVEHLDWMGHERDRAAMRRSREQVLPEVVSRGAIVVFTHSPFPPWGRILATADGYAWQAVTENMIQGE